MTVSEFQNHLLTAVAFNGTLGVLNGDLKTLNAPLKSLNGTFEAFKQPAKPLNETFSAFSGRPRASM